MKDLSGCWHSKYTYTSSSRKGMFSSEHTLNAVHVGKRLILESIPDASGSQLDIELRFDGLTATGSWQEITSPSGYYKGRQFEGKLHLTLSSDHTQLRGEWSGKGSDSELRTGPWELTHL